MEWMKLKRIYKELQKKQMSQLKETMKRKSDVVEVNEGTTSTETAKVEQDDNLTEDIKPPVDAPNSAQNTVTVQITMSTLPADEIEVRVLFILINYL